MQCNCIDTGSAGKTSTKEMLRAAIGAHHSVYASFGNFNNNYGLALTLANMPNEVDYAVETVDGVFEVVTTLEDGQKIVMFEYVDGAWRPSYKSMGEFITEDGGFKLEDALKYLVIRKDGEYKLDQGDYDRFVEEVNGIWEAWCKELVASGNLGAYQDGQSSV